MTFLYLHTFLNKRSRRLQGSLTFALNTIISFVDTQNGFGHLPEEILIHFKDYS